MFERQFELHEYRDAEPFAAAGFDVTALRLPHYTLETYGFRVARDGTTFAYSGDSAPSERLEELARDADLFVCEATLRTGADDGLPRGHLSLEEAVAAHHASGARRLLVTHRPAELPLDPGLELAYDGLELSLDARRRPVRRDAPRGAAAACARSDGDEPGEEQGDRARAARRRRSVPLAGRRHDRRGPRRRERRPASDCEVGALCGPGAHASTSQGSPRSRVIDMTNTIGRRRSPASGTT